MMGKITGTGLLKVADRGLFLSYVCAVVAVYILDFIFFGSLVAFGPLTFVFVLIGFVLRSGAVFAGIVLQTLRGHDEIKGDRAMIRALWIFCVVACLASAINFFAAGHADKAGGVLMGREVASAEVSTKDARIATITEQIALIRSDRDAAIAEARKSIDAIKDDVAGMSAADNASVQKLQDDISKYQDQARADIKEKETLIEAISTEKADNQIEQVRTENTDDTWQVFVWLGDNMPFGNSDGWSTWGLFYFAMLIEAIAAFGLGAYVAIHHYLQRIIAHHSIEEDVRSIHHEAELTSARIRAEGLKRKLAREANAAAREMLEDDPELQAGKGALDWLSSLLSVPEPLQPDPLPAPPVEPPKPAATSEQELENIPESEMTSEQLRIWKSIQAKRFYKDARKANHIPVEDHLSTDIEQAAE